MSASQRHTIRRRSIAVLSAAAAIAVLVAQPGCASSHHKPGTKPHRLSDRPNVVLILLDDATQGDLASMPNVQALVADQGTVFGRNYSPDPICCPARATILTGAYPHNHGVLDNVAPLGGFAAFDDSATLATWLDADYRTGLFGKYMNDNDEQLGYVPPGWDTFKIPTRQDTYHYVGPDMYVNGQLTSFPGEEAAHLYSRQARVFMSNSVAAGDPFFAYVSIVTPHAGAPHDDYPNDPGSSPWVPPEYRGTEPRVLPADLSVGEADVSDKPAYIQDNPPLTAAELELIAERNAQKRESLKAVDDEVAQIVSRLTSLGVLDDTLLVFASDNGYMDGQHRVVKGKGLTYEAASRVPLMVRGPGFPADVVYDRVTGLQDIAPTILAATGEVATSPIDGVDLSTLAVGTSQTDRPQLLELYTTAGLSDVEIQHGTRPTPAQARRLKAGGWFARGFVASNGWKYVEYPQTGEAELYNLNADPFELDNVVDDPAYANRVETMATRLAGWKNCSGAACR